LPGARRHGDQNSWIDAAVASEAAEWACTGAVRCMAANMYWDEIFTHDKENETWRSLNAFLINKLDDRRQRKPCRTGRFRPQLDMSLN
jgi:hypothetical protein